MKNGIYIWVFYVIFICFNSVYAQIIDNRELPPDLLKVRPPFVPTDRADIGKKDLGVFIVLDNADDIHVKEHKDTNLVEIVMIGNVRIHFEDSVLKAETMHVMMKDSEVLDISAYGNVEFTLNNTKYLTKSLFYQPQEERGIMYDTRSILPSDSETVSANDLPWFYRAEKVTIQNKDSFVLDNVTLTKSDTRFDHFSIKAKKLWFLKDKMTLALGMQYLTGQASFLWLPAFMRIEDGGRLYTSFGNERRIGYYFINNYNLGSPIGDFHFGFDFYPQQGQYYEGSYKAKSYGIIEKFDFEVSMANDIRTVKNGDLFSQWVQPQFNKATDLQRITQFAWHYKLNTTIRTNDISINVALENLNDPFFMEKYSYRKRFDNSKSINFAELLNPSVNSWFGYQGAVQPSTLSFTQSVGVTAKNLTVNGRFEFLRVSQNVSTIDPKTGQRVFDSASNNQFLNSFYKYHLRSMQLPDVKYRFPSQEIIQHNFTQPNTATIKDSRGISKVLPLSKIDTYVAALTNQIRTNIITNIRVAEDLEMNISTNFIPIEIDSITTNNMSWIGFTLKYDGEFHFLSEQTLGTNTTLMTTDIKYLSETNWTTIADLSKHEENANLRAELDFFNKIVNIENAIKINYTEQWSSHTGTYTNNQRISGIKCDYFVESLIHSTNQWHDDSWKRVMTTYKFDVQYTYPFYYLFRLQENYLKESSFAWTNIVASEFLQINRSSIFGVEAGVHWIFRHRVPEEDQKKVIEQNPADIFLNNKIFDQLTFVAKGKFFWVKIGTEIMIDILQTATNTNSSGALVPVFSSGDAITNRFIGGYPKLVVEFIPDSKYHYLPKIVYRYNLFEKEILTNFSGDPSQESVVYRRQKHFNLDLVWDLRFKHYYFPKLYPIIYEMTEFGLLINYYMDFVNLRNSYLKLDFMILFKCTKYLSIKLGSTVLNNKIYLYYKGSYNGQPLLAPGEVGKDFFADLGDSLKIWDQDALKRASFKLQSLQLEFIHDLRTWDMRFIFNLGRRVDDVKQVSFWEPYIGLAFTMKGSNAANIFPELQKRFVPTEYQ